MIRYLAPIIELTINHIKCRFNQLPLLFFLIMIELIAHPAINNVILLRNLTPKFTAVIS